MKQHVLILCTGNSARSQMAEGLLRALAGDRFEVFSAGSKPSSVNPLAIAAMDERGIDIRSHRSKHLNEYLAQPFDYVITVCDNAAEACPLFPGPARRIHWSFPDPAAVEGSEAERLASFRQVRDAIEAQLKIWLAAPGQPITPPAQTRSAETDGSSRV
jgi:arsenate reductase